MTVRLIVDETVHLGLILGVGPRPARRCGAEREVRRIAAENDRVLERCKIVGRTRTGRAEDLHDKDLRIRRHTDRTDRLRCVNVARTALEEAVGRRDARNVRAVVGAGVLVVDPRGMINVVVSVGDLGIHVVARAGFEHARRDLVQFLPRHQQVGFSDGVDRVHKRVRIHALMVDVETGVDDRDAAACAGVTELIPGILRADHVFTGVSGVRLIAFDRLRRFEDRLDFDFSDAFETLDHEDVLVRDLNGDRVDQDRQMPFDRKRMTDRGFDPRLQFVLLSEELFDVRDRTAVFRNALRIVALIDRGLAVQEDGDADGLIQILLNLEVIGIKIAGFLRLVFLAQFMDVQCCGIQILHLERCALRRGIGFRAFRDRARDARCDRQREHHENRDQHGKKSSHFGHASLLPLSFLFFFRWFPK